MTNDRTNKYREQTVPHAAHKGEYWSVMEDELVLRQTERGADVELALSLGRTYDAVQVRRSNLKKMLHKGLTLEQIHEAERALRQRAAQRIVAEVNNICDECFCNPHIPGCSNEGETK